MLQSGWTKLGSRAITAGWVLMIFVEKWYHRFCQNLSKHLDVFSNFSSFDQCDTLRLYTSIHCVFACYWFAQVLANPCSMWHAALTCKSSNKHLTVGLCIQCASKKWLTTCATRCKTRYRGSKQIEKSSIHIQMTAELWKKRWGHHFPNKKMVRSEKKYLEHLTI